VVFFAGHGFTDDGGKFCLTTVDWLPGRPAETLVPGDLLTQRLADMPGRVMLLLDACYSGGVPVPQRRPLAVANGRAMATLMRDLTSESCGVVVLAAARPGEESLESAAKQHGFFTWALLEGIRDGKADVNPQDGWVTLSEILGYVEYHTPELSGDRQNPMYDKPMSVASFRLSKAP
jgi:uncharacterized caspase-like protein